MTIGSQAPFFRSSPPLCHLSERNGSRRTSNFRERSENSYGFEHEREHEHDYEMPDVHLAPPYAMTSVCSLTSAAIGDLCQSRTPPRKA